MASTFTATLYSGLTTVETLNNPDVPVGTQIVHSQFTDTISLTSASTPDLDNVAYQTYTLTSGAVTIDFTTIQLNNATNSLTGKKIRVFKIKNNGTSAMTAVVGASNGYTGFGTSFNCKIPAGGHFEWYDGGNGTAVSSSVKTIDISGTGSTDTLQVTAGDGD